MATNLSAFVLVASALPAFSAVDPYDARWERLSTRYDQLISTTQGQLYEDSIVDIHNSFWKAISEKCSPIGAQTNLSSFRAIAVLDQFGVIVEFLPLPNRTELSCFTTEMVGHRYPAPPFAPYLVRYSIDLPPKQ